MKQVCFTRALGLFIRMPGGIGLALRDRLVVGVGQVV